MAGDRTKRPKDKKNALVGSGGNNRRRPQGKGPTPKAEDRICHPTHERKLVAEVTRREQARLEKADRLHPELNLTPEHELIARRNAILEAVRSGIPLSHVFVSGGVVNDERLDEMVCTATAFDVPLFEASHTELDHMIDDAVHQRVAIEVPPYEYADVEDLVERAGRDARVGRPGLVVALGSVTDPHNLGAVMRSVSTFGADDIVVPERRSAGVSATMWKASAGAAACVPAARVPSLVAALGKLEARDYFAVGFDRHGDTMIEDISFADTPIVLVAGSEGKGLARLTHETCDAIIPVPIAVKLESLNVAVTIGIALYQVDRLRACS